jgi:phosphoenolpyruvate-protein kinase (PTS system EI component)
MTGPMRFAGLPVSDGIAAGALYLADNQAANDATPDQVANAFAAVSAERAALADRLRAAGRADEADIIAVSALIAGDRALTEPAVAAVRAGTDAAAAVRRAADAQAAVLAALGNAELADRAADIRQIGQAVIEHLSGGRTPQPACDFILVRREVAAADLVELAEQGLVGAASVTGGASSHAAIVARGLGVPMVTGLDPTVLNVNPGHQAVVDADAGELIIGQAAAAGAVAAHRRRLPGSQPGEPIATRTADDFEITILCNVASAAETRRGLASGAVGVGLLRTEIPFTNALAWPTLADHEASLAPILGLLSGRRTTVRLLDFSGDKVPPFLRRSAASGLDALLAHPAAAQDQLAAALETGREADLAILLPMVSSPAEVTAVRAMLAATASRLGAKQPPLGIMVELAGTAAAAEKFTSVADFFSIGTNDLTAQVLGLDRRDLSAGPAQAAAPAVLRLIGHVADVAATAGLPVSVCGDAAADSQMLPLLLGLGVRALSVPAARVERVRSVVSGLNMAACQALAADSVAAEYIEEVRELVRRGHIN